MAKSLYNPDEIRKAITTLHPDGQPFEVRAIKARIDNNSYVHNAITGYFDSFDSLMAQIGRLKSWKGLYVTFNTLSPECLERCPNRFYSASDKERKSTSDADIIGRRWILIDCDPIRPKDTNSTNEELDRARQRARTIYAFLKDMGWGEPVIALSGNGSHMLFPTDLSADDAGLVSNALKSLDHRFSDDAVEVDTVVHNPARITKLYGSLTCKGPDSKDRPQRYSEILHVPSRDKMILITDGMLEGLATNDPKKIVRDETIEGVKVGTVVGDNVRHLDIESFIRDHNIAVAYEKEMSDRHLYCLDECPWAECHTSESNTGEAAIGVFDDGTLCFKCFHAHCAHRSWSDFRELHEPGYLDKKARHQARAEAKGNRTAITPPKPLIAMTTQELQKADIPPLRWIVPGWICEGLTLLSAPPKTGKSYLAYDIGLSVASGMPVLGALPTKKCNVLYLNLEDGPGRARRRLDEVWGTDKPAPDNCHIVAITPQQEVRRWGEGCKQQLDWFLEQHQDIGLVIVDTFQLIKPRSSRSEGNAYEADVAGLKDLHAYVVNKSLAMLLLHHTNKLTSDDSYHRISGSTGISASVDNLILIERSQRTETAAVMELTGREIEPAKLDAQFNSETYRWEILGDHSERCRTVLRDEVLAIIKTMGQVRLEDIHQEMRDRGHERTKGALAHLLKKMMDENKISKLAHGLYAATTPYFDIEEPVEPLAMKQTDAGDAGDVVTVDDSSMCSPIDDDGFLTGSFIVPDAAPVSYVVNEEDDDRPRLEF